MAAGETVSRYDRSIVEGPLRAAVWKIAWPTMFANVISGGQGIVDHILVGNLVGYQANAAIGVSWQILLVVIAFISSLFTGMSVLVARFAGAGDSATVDRVVYQAFLTALGLLLGILAPVGYFAAPWLLDAVHARPEVQVEALPYLRIMFCFSSGMMLFFMLAGALRSAGDARTPMILGLVMTGLNLLLNIVLIRGLGPIPPFGTRGSAMGTCITGGLIAIYALWKLWRGGWVVAFPRSHGLGLDWKIIRELFRFGLPSGFQGIAMNIGGVVMQSFIGSLAQSAAAQAVFAVSYGELFALITWTSVGLMGAAAAVAGQNLGAGHPDRADQAVRIAARYLFRHSADGEARSDRYLAGDPRGACDAVRAECAAVPAGTVAAHHRDGRWVNALGKQVVISHSRQARTHTVGGARSIRRCTGSSSFGEVSDLKISRRAEPRAPSR